MRILVCWSGERSRLVANALSRWLSTVLPSVQPWPVQIAPYPAHEDELPTSFQSTITMMVITKENLRLLAETEEIPDTMAVLVDLAKDELAGALRAYPAWLLRESSFVDMMLTLNYTVEPSDSRQMVVDRAQKVWHRLQTQLQAVIDPPFGHRLVETHTRPHLRAS